MDRSEETVLTFLFERSRLPVDGVDPENGTAYLVYKPLEVISGVEVTIGKAKALLAKKVKTATENLISDENDHDTTYQFSHIQDLYGLGDRFVYGFPLIINSKCKMDPKQVIKEMNELIKDLRDYKIIHVFGGLEPTYLKLFLSDGQSNIALEGNNYYELFDTIYSTLMEDMREIVVPKKEIIADPQVSRYNRVIPGDYLYADDIFNVVSKTVRRQDDAIRKIATAIAKNSRLESPTLKSTMLVCGPTGVGKSEIFRVIHDEFDIPITFEDSNEYTASGYKGKDTIEMLQHLIQNAGGDIEKAQRGILAVDEIDKKVSGDEQHAVYAGAVINSLLKMMEGHVYNVPYGKNGEVQFDTSLLTFAFLGAFSGIEQFSNVKRNIGFTTPEQDAEAKDVKNIYTTDAIKLYGLLPEFVGRCNTLVTLGDLEIDDLVEIIKTSNKSQLLLYAYLFKTIGIDFIYDEKTILAIAKKAKDLKLGARSINKIVEDALEIANFQLFARNTYSKLIISPETIEDNKQFILK